MSVNRNNLSIIQGLLDIKATLKISGEDTSKVDDLLNDLLHDTKLTRAAEDRFNSHLYPEKKLIYYRQYKNGMWYQLDIYEQAILEMMLHHMTQFNLVSVTKDDLEALLDISKRTIQTSIHGLIDKGCIKVVRQYKKGTPAVYMVNPDISQIGRPKVDDATFWQGVPDDIRYKYAKLKDSAKYDMGKVVEKTISPYGIIVKKQKKEAPTSEQKVEAANNDTELDNLFNINK